MQLRHSPPTPDRMLLRSDGTVPPPIQLPQLPAIASPMPELNRSRSALVKQVQDISIRNLVGAVQDGLRVRSRQKRRSRCKIPCQNAVRDGRCSRAILQGSAEDWHRRLAPKTGTED